MAFPFYGANCRPDLWRIGSGRAGRSRRSPITKSRRSKRVSLRCGPSQNPRANCLTTPQAASGLTCTILEDFIAKRSMMTSEPGLIGAFEIGHQTEPDVPPPGVRWVPSAFRPDQMQALRPPGASPTSNDGQAAHCSVRGCCQVSISATFAGLEGRQSY